MQSKNGRKSYLYSAIIHGLVIILFMAFNINTESELDEFVTVGFGTFGKVSTPGSPGKNKEVKKETVKPEVAKMKSEEVVKKVELPKAKNTENENVIKAKDKKKEEQEAPPQKVEPLTEQKEEESAGGENVGAGNGNFGFEIDFGGKGVRKIYSYQLPAYPQGVSKEIDVKLRFYILPDGTVGSILPLIKADTKLEEAAMNSLKQWRFEPLPSAQNQKNQFAIIVFPYRLR